MESNVTTIAPEILLDLFDKNEMLAKAIDLGKIETVKLIINSITDFSTELKQIDNLIEYLYDEEQIDMLKLLLTKNIPVNFKNNALLEAIENEEIELIKLLLDNGADVNYIDNCQCPLITAAKTYSCESTEIIKLLIEKEADVNLIIKNTDSVLTIICHSGHSSSLIENVKLLLDNGADINYQRKYDGYTALMISIQRFSGLTELLVQKGADLTLKNHNGKMAKDITSARDLIKLLTPTVPKVPIVTKSPYYGLCSTIPRSDVSFLNAKHMQKGEYYYQVFPLVVIRDDHFNMPTKAQLSLRHFADENTKVGIFWL